jgi:uncharacterized protein YecE (DUF72 family)
MKRMASPRATAALPGAALAPVHVGVGGWSYAPWRETFYPADVPQKRELEYASRALTAIEINSTFYRAPSADSYARWREMTPPGFVFTLKAPRFITQARDLAARGEAAANFIEGAAALGDRLGPFLWQLPPTRAFDPGALERFFGALPRERAGRQLRHALEVRHPSFADPRFVALARKLRIAIVFNDAADYPSIADLTADFVYARLRRSRAGCRTGYAPRELARWAGHVRTWAAGGMPEGLPCFGTGRKPAARPREVFLYFISGAKERNPAAARALIARLG